MAEPDYVEIAGRTIKKEPTRLIYRTQGVATLATDATAPHQGSTLADVTGTAVPPICQGVELSETRYPGRILFAALFEQPLSRTEFQAL
jgi:hypothetical protein